MPKLSGYVPFVKEIVKDQYVVEEPSGEIIWVTKREMRLLSDYSMIRYIPSKNIWVFYTSWTILSVCPTGSIFT